MGKGENGAVKGFAICGAACLCCCVVGVVLGLFGIGIAKIVMGAVHIHDCPLERLIPIWLIVSGVAPIFFSGAVRKPKGEEGKEEEETGGCANVARSICGAIALVFNLAWLICGSVWIYPTYGKVNEDGFTPCAGNVTTGCSDDCHKPTLTFAFAMVTMDWIFFAFWLIAIGCSVRQVLAKAKESQNLKA